MIDIERKVLALLKDCGGNVWEITRNGNAWVEALCRAIEQHEAYKQEVSDAVEHFKRCYPGYQHASLFDRFIITKPDPLQEILLEEYGHVSADADAFRAALAKRGLEIREKGE